MRGNLQTRSEKEENDKQTTWRGGHQEGKRSTVISPRQGQAATPCLRHP